LISKHVRIQPLLALEMVAVLFSLFLTVTAGVACQLVGPDCIVKVDPAAAQIHSLHHMHALAIAVCSHGVCKAGMHRYAAKGIAPSCHQHIAALQQQKLRSPAPEPLQQTPHLVYLLIGHRFITVCPDAIHSAAPAQALWEERVERMSTSSLNIATASTQARLTLGYG
jgi:hypothetical protein